MKKIYTVLFLAILVLVSCEFEPSGEFSPEVVEPGDAPPIRIDLNVEYDTIFVEANRTLDFNFQTTERKLHLIRICLGNLCETYESSTGSFRISMHENVSPGTHVLTIEIYTGTGSGSIADALGGEGFLYSRTWTVVVYEKLEYETRIFSVKPDNGSLKIAWKKFRYPGFQEYIVVKSPEGAHSEIIAIIKDKDITSVYDSSYVGGSIDYRVDVRTVSGDLRGVSMSYQDELPKVYVTGVMNNLLTLSWERSRYINNIQGYEIYAKYSESGYELKAKISNSNDTSYILDRLKFLYFNEILLMPVPNKMPYYIGYPYQYLGVTTSAGYIGDKLDAGPILTPMGDFLYYQKGNFIYEYNYITGAVTDSLELSTSELTFSVSPNGKHILAVEDKKSIVLYNTGSKETRKYSLDQLSDDFGDLFSPAISDNGIGVFHLSDYGTLNNSLLYDFNNDKKIFQDKINHVYGPYKISPDGKYLAYFNRVFEIHSDTIVEAPDINYELSNAFLFDFNMNDPELFVQVDEDYVYMKRLSDFSKVSECFIPWRHIFNIDYNTNHLLIIQEENFRVYDIISCEELYSYPTSYFSGIYFDGVRYCNKTIYDSYLGLKLRLD
jgi:hypothetical protein